MAVTAVSLFTAMEPVPFNDTGKPSPFGDAGDINTFPNLKNVRFNRLAEAVFSWIIHTNFTQKSKTCFSALFQMSFHRLVNTRFLFLAKPKLKCIISIRIDRLYLGYRTRAHLNNRYRYVLTFRGEQPHHPNFFTYQSFTHYLYSVPLQRLRNDRIKCYSLISTSTPGERSSFIKASTVCWVGSRISSSRLCVLISNCSRDFLST